MKGEEDNPFMNVKYPDKVGPPMKDEHFLRGSTPMHKAAALLNFDEVDKLLGKRRREPDGSNEYLVRWKGYSKRFDTWELETDISQDMLDSDGEVNSDDEMPEPKIPKKPTAWDAVEKGESRNEDTEVPQTCKHCGQRHNDQCASCFYEAPTCRHYLSIRKQNSLLAQR